MRDYELVTIFKSALAEEEIQKKMDRYHGVATDDGGELSAVEYWGKQQLAYPIDGEANGFYVVSQFTAEPDGLEELERLLKLDEDLLRHLVVLNEGQLATPPALRQEDEDDEDEEEDEEEERPRSRGRGRKPEAKAAAAGEEEESGTAGSEASGESGNGDQEAEEAEEEED